VLDTALRSPGRFDREILIGVPDKVGRKEIFAIHTRDMPLHDIDLSELAEKTHGFVGADIKALCQEAGFKALRRILPGVEDTDEELSQDFLDAIKVEMQDFEEALKEMRPSSGRSFEVNLAAAGWEHVAGYADEIEFLEDVILWPLRNTQSLLGMGITGQTGLLITGPPGVGKTLMARSLAKESSFNAIEIRCPELLSKYMGESERNVRELFRQARQMAPTVLILDGIESIASSGWSDSKVIDRVVNQLVIEMNSVSSDRPILVVAITNSADDIPPALRATGKFDNELRLKLPDFEDRIKLFQMYLHRERVTFAGEIEKIAANAGGLTAGDIEEVCRIVILKAARCAANADPSIPCEVTISEGDLNKALDLWRLTAHPNA
jgi:transitional endoplasmic reticulum ATPase